MQALLTTLTDRAFRYDQLARAGMVALFTQTNKQSGSQRYEVVRLHIAPAHTWPNGTVTPEREAYPPSAAWGTRGWTFTSLDAAQAHMQALVAQDAQRQEAADALE